MKSLIDYINESYIFESNVDNNKVIDYLKSNGKDKKYITGVSLNKGQVWLDALKDGGLETKRQKCERCSDVANILKPNGYEEIFKSSDEKEIKKGDYNKDCKFGDIALTVSRSDIFGELSIYDGKEWIFPTHTDTVAVSMYDPWIMRIYRKL